MQGTPSDYNISGFDTKITQANGEAIDLTSRPPNNPIIEKNVSKNYGDLRRDSASAISVISNRARAKHEIRTKQAYLQKLTD